MYDSYMHLYTCHMDMRLHERAREPPRANRPSAIAPGPMRGIELAFSRRAMLAGALAAIVPRRSAHADSALWPRAGLFPDCPAADVCVSSQDDRPQSWDNPWVFEGSVADSYKALRRTLESKKFNGRVVATDGERYLQYVFEDSGPLGTAYDDAEFFFAPNDTLVQCESRRKIINMCLTQLSH